MLPQPNCRQRARFRRHLALSQIVASVGGVGRRRQADAADSHRTGRASAITRLSDMSCSSDCSLQFDKCCSMTVSEFVPHKCTIRPPDGIIRAHCTSSNGPLGDQAATTVPCDRNRCDDTHAPLVAAASTTRQLLTVLLPLQAARAAIQMYTSTGSTVR
jgi:hypothetical protein